MKKEEFLKRSTAKKIKESRGHDGPSVEWDVYFDGKKICNCWDDSYGGELDVTNYKGKSIEEIYSKIDRESLWDSKWDWTTSLELLLEEVKIIGLMKKDEKKGVIVGTPYNYQIHGFKTNIPTSFKKWPDTNGAGKSYQDMIDDSINKGLTILNADYLRTWNLNV
jgi:hypothetical protein|tara:strand:+ start:213 stop:707 length:495 start_codon:yes stop_codon:yes gene_type:complete